MQEGLHTRHTKPFHVNYPEKRRVSYRERAIVFFTVAMAPAVSVLPFMLLKWSLVGGD